MWAVRALTVVAVVACVSAAPASRAVFPHRHSFNSDADDTPSPPPNIARVGYGVNTLFASQDGDPSCTDKTCGPPGFAPKPVFDMTAFSDDRSFDGRVAVPDGWSFRPRQQCQFDSRVQEIHSWSDYDAQVNAFTRDKHHGLFHSSTRTSWYHAITQMTAEGSSVLVRKSAWCSTYTVRRDWVASHRFLDKDFKKAAQSLPAKYDDTPDKKSDQLQTQFNFVQDYGLAVIKWAMFGGEAVQVSQFDHHSYSLLKRQYGDLSSSATLNMLCSLGDGVLCHPGDPNFDAAQAFQNSTSSQQRSYVPVFVTDHNMGYGGDAWSRAVEQDPDVIEYTTDSITSLFNRLAFPDDGEIAQRGSLLLSFIQNQYCTMLDGGCPTPPMPQARWQHIKATDLPDARASPTVVSLEFATNQSESNASTSSLGVVVIGGINASTSDYNSPLAFGVNASSWSYLAPLSAAQPASAGVSKAAAAVLKGTPVSTGGLVNGAAIASVLRYNPQALGWQNLQDMQSARYSHCAVVADDTLLVIGGFDGSNVLGSVEAFDVEQNLWKSRQPMPVARFAMGCSVVNGTLVYVIGGQNSSSMVVPTVDIYDAATDAWITEASRIPPQMRVDDIPRFGHAQALVGSSIFVIGGANNTDTSNTYPALQDVRVLSLDRNEWAEGCPLLEPASGAAAAVIPASLSASGGDEIHVVGGSATTSASDCIAVHQTFVIPGNASLSCNTHPARQAAAPEPSSGPSPTFMTHDDIREVQSAVAMAARRHALAKSAKGVPSVTMYPAASYLGSGVSTIYGELTGASVLDVACSSCFSGNFSLNGLQLPSAVGANSLSRCSYRSQSVVITDQAEASLSAAAFFNVAAHLGLPLLFSYSFSAGFDFQASASAMLSEDLSLVHTTAECTHSDMSFLGMQDTASAQRQSLPPLSDDFVQAVQSAPSYFDASDPWPFVSILQHFGDHVAVGLTRGSRATQRFSLERTNFTASLHAHADLYSDSSHSFLCFWGSSHQEDASASIQADIRFSRYVQHNSTTCKPFCPPAVVNGTSNTSTWYDAVQAMDEASPAADPIRYALVPVTSFISPAWFGSKANASHLATVRSILSDLMQNGTYCDYSTNCHSVKHVARWAARTPCPDEGCLQDAAVTVHNGYLYLVGGSSDSHAQPVVARAAISDLKRLGGADWNYISPLPQPRAQATALVVQGALVVLGGSCDAGPQSSVYSYSFSTRSWQPLPSLPMNITHPSAVANETDGTIIVFSGGDSSCQAFVLAAGATSWKAGQRHSQACVSQAAAVLFDNTAFIMGGQTSSGGCSNAVLTYNIESDTFDLFSSLPWPTCTPRALKLDDQRALLLDDQGHVFTFVPSANQMTALETGPAVELQHAGLAYDGPSDLLLLASPATSDIFVMQHAANSSFSPTQSNSNSTLFSNHQQRQQPEAFNVESTSDASSQGLQPQQPKLSSHSAPPQGSSRVDSKPRQQLSADRRATDFGDKPTKRFPFIFPLLHGYHPIFGDPLVSTGQDSGWRPAPVFSPPPSSASDWKSKMIVPGDPNDWLLPDGVNGQGYPDSSACKYFEFSKTVSDNWSYRRMMDEFYPIASGKFGWPRILGYKYSVSATAQFVERATATFDAGVTIAVGRCKRYTLSISPSDTPFAFAPEFVEDLASLSTVNNASDDQGRLAFVQRYGLAVPKHITFGALVARVSASASAAVKAAFSGDFDLEAGAKANLLFLFGLKAGGSADVNIDMDNTFRAGLFDNYTVCMPTCPPASPDCESDGSVWQSSLLASNTTLQPIGAELMTLLDAVDQMRSLLPKDLQGPQLDQRLEALSAFINDPARMCQMIPGCTAATSAPVWTQADIPPLRTAVSYATPIALNDSIAFIGGETGTGPDSAVNNVQVYEISGQWVTRYFLNNTRSRAAGAVTATGQVWVCGGSNATNDGGQGNALVSCEVSIRASTPWTPGPSLNLGRSSFAMAAFTNKLYVFGGLQGYSDDATNTIEVLDLSVTPASQRWSVLPLNLSRPLQGLSALTLPHMERVVLVGGSTGRSGSAVTDVTLFNGTSLVAPSPHLTLPETRYAASLVMLDNSITTLFVFGGYGGPVGDSTSPSSATYLLNLSQGTVSFGPALPQTLIGASSLVYPAATDPTLSDINVVVAGGLRADAQSPTVNITMAEYSTLP